MISDSERRAVAARLREVQAYVIPGAKTEVHPITGRIIGVACGYDLPDFQGLLGYLADLIDPDTTSEQTNQRESSLSASPIDRDALLELVDEMETADPEDLDVAIDYVTECASRIREACGVAE